MAINILLFEPSTFDSSILTALDKQFMFFVSEIIGISSGKNCVFSFDENWYLLKLQGWNSLKSIFFDNAVEFWKTKRSDAIRKTNSKKFETYLIMLLKKLYFFTCFTTLLYYLRIKIINAVMILSF